MTQTDAPPTRAAARAARVGGGTGVDTEPRGALHWVDEGTVSRPVAWAGTLADATVPYEPATVDLLQERPRRSPWRSAVLVPIVTAFALAGAYAATTLLWPLHAVPPIVEARTVTAQASAPTALTWPDEGVAAVSVAGFPGTVASSGDVVPIASITKLVTSLMVLDQEPLALGEEGREFFFTGNDNIDYWAYRWRGESALDVPIGGSLTQHQMLEAILIGSANNHAERLARTYWPTNAVFADAARTWLDAHDIPGLTIVEPTGIDPANRASAESLIPLAARAMAHPVVAEIVARRQVELPGAGLVSNTNGLLADAGVLGVKTGALDRWNLLSAKDVTVGTTPVRLYAAVLDQGDDAARVGVSRSLYAQLENELQPSPSVDAGTVVGVVTTAWGERVEMRTTQSAEVVLWNGAAARVDAELELGDLRAAGDPVGTLVVTGPLDATTVTVALADDVDPPSPWWRLTHPLDLFGLN